MTSTVFGLELDRGDDVGLGLKVGDVLVAARSHVLHRKLLRFSPLHPAAVL